MRSDLHPYTSLSPLLPPQDAHSKASATGKGPASALSMDLPKAAKNLRDLEAVLEEVDLKGIELVDRERSGYTFAYLYPYTHVPIYHHF